MAIGIFGGSFNPIHIAHLIMARYAVEQVGLEKVIFVPSYIQPLKGKLITPAKLRYEWVKKSISRYPKFEVSNYEIEVRGKSYTYNTIKHFKSLYEDKIYFIMGEDSLVTFKYWYKYQELAKMTEFIVYPRLRSPNYIKKIDKGLLDNVVFLKAPLIQISSTLIRERISNYQEVDWFLPDEIRNEVISYYENI